MTTLAFAALTVRFSAINLAEMQQGTVAINDRPLPIPVTSNVPALAGDTWPAGTVFSFTFGVLAARDITLLSGYNATSVTVTIYVPEAGWRRVTGTAQWSSPTLTVTTTTPNIIEPWVTPI